MANINFYTSNPGEEVLLGQGPGLNIIEIAQVLQRFARGQTVICEVGAVVNDRGRPNEAIKLNGNEDLISKYGGFKDWLGNGYASGYEGNLCALTDGLDAFNVVACFPDFALRTAAEAVTPMEFTLGVAATTVVGIPAGTRFTPVADPAKIIATLEDVSWAVGETGAKAVRVRHVSGSLAAGIQIYDTMLAADGTLPDNVTITSDTAVATHPLQTDVTHLDAIYETALDSILATAAGRTATIVFTDRNEKDINVLLKEHCVDAASEGYFRIGVVAPPVGTTSANAQDSGHADGSRNPTYFGTSDEQKRMVYAHPGVIRRFSTDSENLAAPDYLATVPAQALTAYRIAMERPEVNPARPHDIMSKYRVVGLERPSDGLPVSKDHWNAGIMQPILEVDYESNVTFPSYFSGVTMAGTEIADRRMTDFLYVMMLSAAVPFHKNLASPSNQQNLLGNLYARFQRLIDDERILGVSITGSWDGTVQMYSISVKCQLVGNMNVITFNANIGTGVSIEEG